MKEENTSVVQFTKIRNVISPARANNNDAGTDWFIPEYDEIFLNDLVKKNTNNSLEISIVEHPSKEGKQSIKIIIPPGEQVKIPSGIKVWILNKNSYLQATNKSGIATKFHLIVGADTIDADYQGEVHINLCNIGSTSVELFSGQKVVQFVHKEYIKTEWQEIPNAEYNNIEVSSRGAGGFGSTGIFQK